MRVQWRSCWLCVKALPFPAARVSGVDFDARNVDPYEAPTEIRACLQEREKLVLRTVRLCVAALSAFRGQLYGCFVFTHPNMHKDLQEAETYC